MSVWEQGTGRQEVVVFGASGGGSTPVTVAPASSIVTAQQAVGTLAVLLAAANATFLWTTVTQLGTVDVYIGGTNAVTTSTGTLLVGIRGASITIPTDGAIYGISASSSSVSTITGIK